MRLLHEIQLSKPKSLGYCLWCHHHSTCRDAFIPLQVVVSKPRHIISTYPLLRIGFPSRLLSRTVLLLVVCRVGDGRYPRWYPLQIKHRGLGQTARSVFSSIYIYSNLANVVPLHPLCETSTASCCHEEEPPRCWLAEFG